MDLYVDDRMRVRVDAERIHIAVSQVPPNDDIAVAVKQIAKWCNKQPGDSPRVALHIEHVESDHLDPPNAPALMCIATELMKRGEIIGRMISGTCVQAIEVDDAAMFAKNVFLTFYHPERPFDLVAGAEEAKCFLKRCSPH